MDGAVPDFRAMSEDKLATASQVFDAGIYASSIIISYLAALAAAREVVFKKTLVRPPKPDAVRRRLTTLVWSGLEFDPQLLQLLKAGRRRMLELDYGPRPVRPSREEAADYLAHAR